MHVEVKASLYFRVSEFNCILSASSYRPAGNM